MATNVGRVEASIVPETSGFAAQADAALTPVMDRLGRKLGEGLSRSMTQALDFSGVNTKLQEALDRAELQAMRAGRMAGRNFAMAMRSEVEPGLRNLPEARIRVSLDRTSLADFQARMADLTRPQNQTITVHVRADDAQRGLLNLRNSTDDATRSLGGATGAGASAGGIGLMGALQGVGVALGVSLLPAIGAAVPIMAGAALGAGTLKVAFSGVSDAVALAGKDQKKYAEALKKMGPEQRDFTKAVVDLKKQFGPIGKEIQKAALPGFTKAVKDAAPVVKILGKAMVDLGGTFGDLAEKAGRALKDSGLQKDLQENLKLGTGFIKGMASSVGDLTRSLLDFGAKSKPTLDSLQNLLGGLLSKGLPDFFKGLEPGIQGASQVLDGLAYALNIKLLPALGRFAGEWAKSMGPLFEQGLKLLGDIGGAALDTLTRGLKVASPLMHDLAEGMRGFREVAADITPTMKDVGRALADAFIPGNIGEGPLKRLADSIDRNKGAIQEAARFLGITILDMVQVGVNSLPLLVQAFRMATTGILIALDGIVSGAAKAFGWVPGIGGKLKAVNKEFDKWAGGFEQSLGSAQRAADGFASSTSKKLSEGKLKLDINNWTSQIATAKDQLSKVPPEKRAALKATIADLQAKIAEAKGLLNSLDGKTATTRILTIRETRAVYSTVGRPTSGEGGVSKFASGGHVQAFPAGGYIQGPGSGTSDSILALMGSGAMAHVSNTEYVVRAAAVKKYGVAFLDAINRGVLSAKKLATGGLVPRLASGGSAKKHTSLPKNTVIFAGQRVSESSIISAIGISFVNALQGSASQIQSATDRVVQAIQNAFRGVKTTVDDRVIKMLETQAKKLKDLAKARDALTAKIAQAQQFATDTTSGAKSFASLASLPNSGAGFGASGVLSGLQTRLAQLRTFSGNISKLFKLGLSKGLIQQIIQMGPDQGAAYAAALVQATPAQLKALNSTQSQIDKASASFGNSAADIMYDAGSQAGKGFLTGLKAQQKSIEDSMSSLAKAIQAAIKKALRIKSPSRVMAEIGEHVGQGLVMGMDATHAAIVSSSQRMAMAVQSGVGTQPAQEKSEPSRTFVFNANVTDKPTRQTVMDALRDSHALYGPLVA
ncbi:hypothetical protein ACFRH4_08775 [Streptomyces mirabilis]|uniref:hypothetical protein n=1 Tax=Streptomyces mirabilis TaxID=68239 RepID=UPI0036C8E0A7